MRAIEETAVTSENAQLREENERLRATLLLTRRSNTLRELEVEALFEQKIRLVNELRIAQAKIDFLEGRKFHHFQGHRGVKFWLLHLGGQNA